MALVCCPECGREKVSDSAITCPDCGFGIKEYFNKKYEEESLLEKQKEKDFRANLASQITSIMEDKRLTTEGKINTFLDFGERHHFPEVELMLGQLYGMNSQFDKGIYHHKLAISYCKELENDMYLETIYSSLGSLYMGMINAGATRFEDVPVVSCFINAFKLGDSSAAWNLCNIFRTDIETNTPNDIKDNTKAIAYCEEFLKRAKKKDTKYANALILKCNNETNDILKCAYLTLAFRISKAEKTQNSLTKIKNRLLAECKNDTYSRDVLEQLFKLFETCDDYSEILSSYEKALNLIRNDLEEKSIVKCPRCGSKQITTSARGVNHFWGGIGASQTVNRCAKCGNTWKPRG